MLGTERAVLPSPEQVPLRTSLLCSLPIQAPRQFLLLQPRDHIKIQKRDSCSWGKTGQGLSCSYQVAQSSIPDPGPAGDREDTQGEASRGSGEDPGLAQETVLTVGEGEGRNSHRLKG